MTFGWPGYDPAGYDRSQTLLEAAGERLDSLRGARICSVYTAWDIEDERWCASSPIVFELEDMRLEIGFKLKCQMTLTFGELSLESVSGAGFRGPGPSAERRLPYQWRTDRAELAPFVGRFILGADLLEKRGGRQGLLGICFRTDGGALELVNRATTGGAEITINPADYDRAAVRRVIAI
ncbi:hypothetical protein [Cohnella sp. JJ-181]|uniref:hypothetical protein n=1 Tax=Cohnella rhizoplanae TaxID=2974897 RepID=UPI0022FF5B27|nr:hypothetical protein [Cohnella sp. JJ-181]CAI6031388.1 hypothetical protein COHCIP112018_00715 [Cohnella sp. JJ-181]